MEVAEGMLGVIEPAVTWIKVEKPTFDLVGVVLGSFRLAGVLLVVVGIVIATTGGRREQEAAVPAEA